MTILEEIHKISGICVPEISFGGERNIREQGGRTALVKIKSVQEKDFTDYLALLEAAGFQLRESRSFGEYRFRFYAKEGKTLIASYFPALQEMQLIAEANEDYLGFCDQKGCRVKNPTFTQIDLEDFGLSDVIELEDGRFLLIDGGWEMEPEADKLMEFLQSHTVEGKPVVAAWIMTHPDLDHYCAFLAFWKKYAHRVEIQRFLFNFPDATLTEENTSYMKDEQERLERFHAAVKETGAPVLRVHTGQVYTIGNVQMEILSSPDNLIFGKDASMNLLSLVLKMKIEGQTLLLAGDCIFDYVPTMMHYGDYLKADILQLPHHAFGGGTIPQFRQIDPEVCIAPVSEVNFYRYFCYYFKHNRYLMHDLHVKELLTGKNGKENLTLPLPYTPRPDGRARMLALEEDHQRALGAKTWVFLNMTLEDCKFTALNMTFFPVDVFVDLYFTERKKMVKGIRCSVGAETFVPIDLANPAGLDPDAIYYNPRSLSKRGIPEGESVSVCFHSEVPIVIQGTRPADYHQ